MSALLGLETYLINIFQADRAQALLGFARSQHFFDLLRADGTRDA